MKKTQVPSLLVIAFCDHKREPQHTYMKQGYPNPLPPAPGYGAPSLSQAFINTNAQQKPIRPFFKVPSEGVYKMAEEVVFNPPKAQRKSFQPLAGTKVSFSIFQIP